MIEIKPEHQSIYERLQDDESRQLFLCRYQYCISGNKDILLEEVGISHKYCTDSKYKEAWDSLRMDTKRRETGVILFGAGKNLKHCVADMERNNIAVRAVCDSSETMVGQEKCGYVIIDPAFSVQEYKTLVFVITPTKDLFIQEIHDYLVGMGIPCEAILIYNRAEKQYFGPDFITPVSDEVFIDAGCYDGETIVDFYEFAGKGKVYGFEPDRLCYEKTLKTLSELNYHDVELIDKGLWEKAETIRFKSWPQTAGSRITTEGETQIETVALDDVVNPAETVTLIKMDIEGAELNALKGAAKTIKRCLPRLAICIYHKQDDIVEIPMYILSLNNDYKLYIRHHVPWVYNETVLYALP